MTYLSKFIARIEAFLKRHKLASSNFGVMAANDPNFVFDMRNGIRSPSIRMIERVESFMNNYKKHD